VTLLDALTALSAATGVKHATVALRLATDAAVDSLYDDLAQVDDKGRPAKGQSAPEWMRMTEGDMRWREAAVTVAGVRVIISGPFEVVRKAA
jgi:hypothetical protein